MNATATATATKPSATVSAKTFSLPRRQSGIAKSMEVAGTGARLVDAVSIDPALYELAFVEINGRKAALVPVERAYVHRYNARPVSALIGEGRTAMADDVSMRDIQDPVHAFVDDEGRFAVTDGQRRLIAAMDSKKPHILCWLHEKPVDEVEVYRFGILQHANREEVTALDRAVIWDRLLQDGVMTQGGIATLHGVDQATVSRTVAFCRAPARVRDAVEKNPKEFGERDLYYLVKISELDESRALELALTIAFQDNGVRPSTRELEAVLDGLRAQREASAKEQEGASPESVDKKATARPRAKVDAMKGVGSLKVWPTGRLEFRPEDGVTLSPEAVDSLQKEIAELIKVRLQQIQAPL